MSENPLSNDLLQDVLRTIRIHLGMEVAFISEFLAGRRYFRCVDAAAENPPIEVGNSDLLEESYCQRVIDGRLPELIPDAWLIPAAMELPVTAALPVRAHLSVPIRLSCGQVYGTFCCFSSKPDSTLDEGDLKTMRAFAQIASTHIEGWLEDASARNDIAERVRSVLDTEAYALAYQPIVDFVSHQIVGFEGLTRFALEPVRTPDIWFAEAAMVDLSEELEMAVIDKALRALQHLPGEIYLSLNVSSTHIINGAISRALKLVPLDRIVLEVTEHTAIADYAMVVSCLEPLRRRGLRLAVDDAGAGYASFRHILQLEPDVIKLDISLIRNIDTDARRRALAIALVSFAKEVGIQVVAEGVETQPELETLRNLGITHAQGYLLGRPMEMTAAIALLASGG